MGTDTVKLRRKGDSLALPIKKEAVERIKEVNRSFYYPTQEGANIYTQNNQYTSQSRNLIRDGNGYLLTIPTQHAKEMKLSCGLKCEVKVVTEPGSAIYRVTYKRKTVRGSL